MARTMTGAEMVLAALNDQGVEHIFGYPGGAVLPIYDELLPAGQNQAHPRAPGRRRAARGRRLCALDRQGRRRAGHVRARRHQRGDRPHRRADGFDPAGVHHRAGADAPHRQRRVPGMRYGRHHAALHQAQLAGEERQRPGARPARGVLHRQGRPPRPGRGRHPQGHPVRVRQLRRPVEHRAQDLQAARQAGPERRARSGRADGARQAAGVLHRRRRHQFRARRRARSCASWCASPAFPSPRP